MPRPKDPDLALPSPRARFAAVADRLVAPVLVLGRQATIEYVNRGGAALLRQDPSLLVGRRFSELAHPGDRAALRRALAEVAAGRPSGRIGTFRLRAQPSMDWQVMEMTADNLLEDPDVAGILMSLRDLTAQLAQEQTLRAAAFQDPVTGLPNRAAIDSELEGLVADEADLTVGFAGIDRLSLVNDSLGPSAADAIIRAVAGRVRGSMPKQVLVGRVNGYGLVLLFRGAVAADATALVWRAVERVREPMFVAGHEFNVSLSVGLAPRVASATAEGLLRDAGLALRRAQAAGGGRVERFETELRDEAVDRLEVEADLRQATSRGELALAFQPIVRLVDRQPVGSEALLRWHHERGVREPAAFIPVAEDSGLIVPIGEWVIDEAARLAGRAPGTSVSVNLSPRQLSAPALPETIARIAAARNVRSTTLDFEITKTLLVKEFDYAIGVLSAIRRQGFRVGLDDFGTGYSSLSYLRRLPIDFLKIDRSLITDVDVDDQARSIVGAVIGMAAALGIEVVAEGVEREGQAVAVARLGATRAQGHFFGRPTELERRHAARKQAMTRS